MYHLPITSHYLSVLEITNGSRERSSFLRECMLQDKSFALVDFMAGAVPDIQDVNITGQDLVEKLLFYVPFESKESRIGCRCI